MFIVVVFLEEYRIYKVKSRVACLSSRDMLRVSRDIYISFRTNIESSILGSVLYARFNKLIAAECYILCLLRFTCKLLSPFKK